jgi:hypothetical protein
VAELRQNSEVGDRLIAAWDFSPPVGLNTEVIPTAPDDQMAGYFDAGHHTHWVGTRVLDSLRENRLTDEGLQGYRLGEASSAAPQLQAPTFSPKPRTNFRTGLLRPQRLHRVSLTQWDSPRIWRSSFSQLIEEASLVRVV